MTTTVPVLIEELEGVALDWAVAESVKAWKSAHGMFPTMTLDPTFSGIDARCGKCMLVPNNPMRQDPQEYTPSSDWSQGGPLIEKHGVAIRPHCSENEKITSWRAGFRWPVKATSDVLGETALIAAMRAMAAR